MPRNVEIKARLELADVRRVRAALLSEGAPEVIRQEDVFFPVPRGRLKLRFLSPTRGELIFYRRDDRAGPTTSTYSIVPTDRPGQLQRVLESAYGVGSTVRKTRQLTVLGRPPGTTTGVAGIFLNSRVVPGPQRRPTCRRS